MHYIFPNKNHMSIRKLEASAKLKETCFLFLIYSIQSEKLPDMKD